ncbi:MAG: helix-turn-helix domain-containing protein [Armatimonadota bacterium]
MENNETIGAILIRERERRELSLEDVHESTKITVHNIAALEEDRFDHFPNRVYARAFLRDYSNFLGLDSGEMLEKYEADWQGVTREVSVVLPKRRSPWRATVATLLTLIVLGGLAAAGYFYNNGWDIKMPSAARRHNVKPEVAQLPKPEPIAPAKPEVEKHEKKPAQPAEQKPVPPAVLTLEVTASRPVWADIQADGQKVVYGVMPAGVKTVVAKKKVFIKVGQANAVALKLNGKPQPALGNTANMAKKEFVLSVQPVSPPTTNGAAPSPAPTAQPNP